MSRENRRWSYLPEQGLLHDNHGRIHLWKMKPCYLQSWTKFLVAREAFWKAKTPKGGRENQKQQPQTAKQQSKWVVMLTRLKCFDAKCDRSNKRRSTILLLATSRKYSYLFSLTPTLQNMHHRTAERYLKQWIFARIRALASFKKIL